eukprot:4055109-Lingulodinium_polyedra.AAC.1
MPQQIVVSFYLQDGLHAGSFNRWHRARHELYYDVRVGDGDAAASEQRCKDWAIGMRCLLHVASSAVKWSLAQWCSEQ